MDEYDLPYSETLNGMGARGAYLAPDECRKCFTEKNEIVRNCQEHEH